MLAPPRPTPADSPRLLFAYGTLLPRDPIALAREGWSPDGVRGRLFDLGPYPGLIDLDLPGTPWVEGYVRPVDFDELRDRLDPYEGVEVGLFRRATTTTRAGRLAWVYLYGRPIPEAARGPLGRWEPPAAAWVFPSFRPPQSP